MVKNDFGKFKCPFYVQMLDNGARLIVIKRDSKVKSCKVNISVGGFLHTTELSNSKLPISTPFFAMKMVCDDKLKNELAKEEVILDSQIDYSSTCFSLDSTGDIYAGLSKLFAKMSKHEFTEDDLNQVKKIDKDIIGTDQNTEVDKAENLLLNNLYFESPIKDGYLPTSKQALFVHENIVKKFIDSYYVPKIMNIIIASDEDPEEVLNKVNAIRFPKGKAASEKPYSYKENYLTCPKQLDIISSNEKAIVSYGIKFAQRKTIFEKYGYSTFQFYEILQAALFEKNYLFLKGLKEANAVLLKTKFLEANEDSAMIIDVEGENHEMIYAFINEYLASCETKISKGLFAQIINEYYADALRSLSTPVSCTSAFNRTLANNIDFTDLADGTLKLKYENFIAFVKELNTFTKGAVVLKR